MEPLREVERVSVRGMYFWHVPAGGESLFRPEHPSDGRWQRGALVEGFYLAGDEQTEWAEWYRALAELGVPPMRQMPRDLWRFDVRVDGVADLSSDEKLAAVGLEPPVPARDRWVTFQGVGEAVSEIGCTGILYPSAARSGSAAALCLFRRAFRMAGVEPVPPPERHDEPPPPPRRLTT